MCVSWCERASPLAGFGWNWVRQPQSTESYDEGFLLFLVNCNHLPAPLGGEGVVPRDKEGHREVRNMFVPQHNTSTVHETFTQDSPSFPTPK